HVCGAGVCVVFFFFQAEDGIRDWSVTGVQTCALPISPTCGPSFDTSIICRGVCGGRAAFANAEPNSSARLIDAYVTSFIRVEFRSEERRVGKECRSRWWANQ